MWIHTGELFGRVSSVGYGNRRHTCIFRHEQIVRRIADHHRLFRADAGPREQVQQHLRVWLREALVGAAGRDEVTGDALLRRYDKTGCALTR